MISLEGGIHKRRLILFSRNVAWDLAPAFQPQLIIEDLSGKNLCRIFRRWRKKTNEKKNKMKERIYYQETTKDEISEYNIENKIYKRPDFHFIIFQRL